MHPPSPLHLRSLKFISYLGTTQHRENITTFFLSPPPWGRKETTFHLFFAGWHHLHSSFLRSTLLRTLPTVIHHSLVLMILPFPRFCFASLSNCNGRLRPSTPSLNGLSAGTLLLISTIPHRLPFIWLALAALPSSWFFLLRPGCHQSTHQLWRIHPPPTLRYCKTQRHLQLPTSQPGPVFSFGTGPCPLPRAFLAHTTSTSGTSFPHLHSALAALPFPMVWKAPAALPWKPGWHPTAVAGTLLLLSSIAFS
jgi:hypothetical protein